MLRINMISLSEKELEGVVSERCSAFGIVRKVKVYLPRTGSTARTFALVDMATPEQAARLAATMGQLTMDKAVVVFLQHERFSVSALTQARTGANNALVQPSLFD